jgi:hypothetical protein
MAVQIHGTQKVSIIWAAGAFAFAVLLALFLIGSGHNNGQPSAKSGPGNPVQTDQVR